MNQKPINNQKLRKQLNPLHVWAIAFGCIIGWGSFINPGKKFLPNSGVYGTAAAMVLGAITMIIIACSYAYMVPKYPEAGGEFTFAQKCFGPNAAFLCGWFLVAAYLTNVPMNSTAIGLIADGLDGSRDILKWGFHYRIAGFDVWAGEMLVSMVILLLFGVLNILGVRKAAILQTILACLLAASVLILTISALMSPKASAANFAPVWGFDRAAMTTGPVSGDTDILAHTGASGVVSAILACFAIAPWAYVGFDTIPQAAEEFRFSYRKVSMIMVVAILFGCTVYIANNTVAAAVLNDWPQRVSAGEWVVLSAAEVLLGSFGKILVGIAVSSAVLSGIMGFYLASSRLMFAMSREGYLPAFFGRIDPRFGTPRNAILFCMLVSLSGPLLGREALGWFVDMSSIGASIGFFFTCLATAKTVCHEEPERKRLLYLAVIGTVFSDIFMVLQLIPIPGLKGVHFGRESYIMFIIWIALGLVFFFNSKSQKK